MRVSIHVEEKYLLRKNCEWSYRETFWCLHLGTCKLNFWCLPCRLEGLIKSLSKFPTVEFVTCCDRYCLFCTCFVSTSSITNSLTSNKQILCASIMMFMFLKMQCFTNGKLLSNGFVLFQPIIDRIKSKVLSACLSTW